MKKQKIINAQRGISLVEVLVSLVVTGVGLLGVAAIQSISIKMSYDSYLRSQATFLYYDLADRMRANPEADYTLLSSTSYATAPSPTCGAPTSNCNSDQLKDHDLYYWWVTANELLPNPNLTVVPPAGVERLTDIVIEWGNQVAPSTTSVTNGDDVEEVVVRQQLNFQVEI